MPSNKKRERYLVFWIAVTFLSLGSLLLWGAYGLGVAIFALGLLFAVEWIARTVTEAKES